MGIPFPLKRHYCHTGFENIQHNFEITYLHLNYTECPVGIFQRQKHF